jgi:photosystem II stability/assembly factor-like uncharacterized protein
MKNYSALIALTVFRIGAQVSFAEEWRSISDSVMASLKPGTYGPTAGIVVDPKNGTVFMVVSDHGLWRSNDRGETFARCDGKTIGGRCETGWALQADPAGQRLACFMIYGDSAMTTDGGKTWTKFASSHFDFGAVDWDDTARQLLALRHETGGVLTSSADGGKTWTDLGKNFTGCGVFDHSTFVATKAKEPGIFRSTDGGNTWKLVFPETPAAAVPVIYQGKGYWPTGKGVLISADKGETWTMLGTPVDATYGPYFETAQHFVVAGKNGFFETRDAGANWQLLAPLPAGFGTGRVGPNYCWDSRAAILYASTMGKPALLLQLASPRSK